MSTKRFHATYSTKQAMGTNGRLACLVCRGDIENARRKTFCGARCSEDFRLRTDGGFVRRKVYERDHGICALCRSNTMVGWTKRQGHRGTGHRWHADHIKPVVEGGGECGLDNYRTLCVPCHKQVTRELRQRLVKNV